MLINIDYSFINGISVNPIYITALFGEKRGLHKVTIGQGEPWWVFNTGSYYRFNKTEMEVLPCNCGNPDCSYLSTNDFVASLCVGDFEKVMGKLLQWHERKQISFLVEPYVPTILNGNTTGASD